MAVFLNQERTKIGTTTGTLIAFPQELEVNDPNVGNSAELLPAGYLRCDGGIYSETIYPALAQILGTGDGCAFKQEGVTLSNTQFQVPDLRSKFIRASSASDQGVINDNTVINAAGQTVERSGVSVNVSSNVGTTAVVDMTGQYRVPARTVTLTGNVGFTKPRSPDEETVSAQAFLPHLHYTTTYRCRTIRRGGSDVFELNYYNNASTIGVGNWYDATDSGDTGRQPACKHWAQSEVWNTGAYVASGTFLGFGATFEYYGICKGTCGGFITSCLIPTGKGPLNVDTTPEGPCRQTYVAPFGITVGPVGMECASSDKDIGENYVEGATGVGVDNIPTAAATPGGVLQSFSLFESLDVTNGFYNKGLGQWSYSTANLTGSPWSNLSDFVTGDVDMVGGDGSGMKLTVRFEAWPGAGGLPTNTRYKVVAIIDGGTGYNANNTLTFPDIGAYALSSESTQFRLRINTTSFGSNKEDAGAYTHNQSLHNVLPVDTNTDSAINAAYPQVSNIIETTEAFNYEEDPTRHTHTINYNSPLTNYQLNIPEVFIAVDGMSASINIQPESDTKIDSLIAPFVMVDYLIKT